jgi:hypothetical protein
VASLTPFCVHLTRSSDHLAHSAGTSAAGSAAGSAATGAGAAQDVLVLADVRRKRFLLLMPRRTLLVG